MKRKQIRIGTNVYEVRLHEREGIYINDERVEYTLSPLQPDRYLLRIGSRSYEIFIPQAGSATGDGDRTSIFVNGKKIEFHAVDERQILAGRFISIQSAEKAQKQIRAPMPGLVTKILVHDGEQVEKGRGVIVLEAMKMENELKAPASGVVRKIAVKERESVEKNTVLIEFS